MISNILGYATFALNVVYIPMLLVAIISFRRRNEFDIQMALLILSIICLSPVIMFENILFFDVDQAAFSLSYSTSFMRVIFGLGIFAYFIYNLHLLTIEDMPTFPITITGMIIGYAIGNIGISAFVDPTAPSPIYYDPIQGGTRFILSLMFFNFIGFFGFIFSMKFKPYSQNDVDIKWSEKFAILFFFLSPVVIFMARILSIPILTVNSIFLITEISFILHLYCYIFTDKYGYAVHTDLLSLSILRLSDNVALAGYSSQEETGFNKIQGMTILAVDNVIKNVFQTEDREAISSYSLDYGDTVLLKNGDYLLVGLFRYGGKKMGRFVLSRLLNQFVKEAHSRTAEGFERLLKKYLVLFYRDKLVITSDMIYT